VENPKIKASAELFGKSLRFDKSKINYNKANFGYRYELALQKIGSTSNKKKRQEFRFFEILR